MVKKIHYCWFGSPEPDNVKRNVAAWAKMNPDFEIIQWNESNIDVEGFEFAQRAVAARKWAFFSDIVRLKVLLQQGGFYVDADVEMCKPLNSLEEYGNQLIMGYIYNCALGTAVFYSPPNHPYIHDVLNKYHYIKSDFWPVNNSIFTEYFINDVPGFLLNGKKWMNDKAIIFNKNTFEQPSFVRSKGISIHHCCGSWAASSGDAFSFSSGGNRISHLIKWAKRCYSVHRALKSNEFYPNYLAACRAEKLAFDTSKYYQ